MAAKHVLKTTQSLLDLADHSNLHFRTAPERHSPGTILDVKLLTISPAIEGTATLKVEDFAGGGFAGQVYRTTLLRIEPASLESSGLTVGGTYAIKILLPPTTKQRLFRDFIYWLGFQGAFAPRFDPNAARTGALWQYIIRRGAKIRFGDEKTVAQIHATFFDPEMQSYGDIIEWVDGRNWSLEIDREIFSRSRRPDNNLGGAKEYLSKKRFMAEFVRLLHDMGAGELARQYEWWTCKSQPNVVKRRGSETEADAGLTALDFRPGLALLFFLPMSPADFKLILKGFRQGSLVQFDRGDLKKLREFCRKHPDEFAGAKSVLEELEAVDSRYRRGLPDVTRHRFRLIHDPALRRDVKKGLIRGWGGSRQIDEAHMKRLERSTAGFVFFYLLGAVPVFGKVLRRIWGEPAYRRHSRACLTSFSYLRRYLRTRQADQLYKWLDRGRIDERKVDFFLRHSVLFALIRIFPGMLPLPTKIHRALIDWSYARASIKSAVVFPIRFYRDPQVRTTWLENEIDQAERQGIIRPKEREQICSQIHDPFIQKYLKCMAVHFCTFPITKTVMILVTVYAYLNFGNSWNESLAYALAAMLIVSVLPITPGSLIRGLYVVYLMIRERNLRSYWLAAAVSFWHYVGYLGFPLQMVKEFTSLARLLAARWVVRVTGWIPVFGESGALFEHLLFDLCVNTPLSIKRLINRRFFPESGAKKSPANN